MLACMLKTSTCGYLQVVIQLHDRYNEAAVENALGWLRRRATSTRAAQRTRHFTQLIRAALESRDIVL